MKIVHLSNTDSGGAIELHAAMLENGIESSMIVAMHDLGYAPYIFKVSFFHRLQSTLSNIISRKILGPVNKSRGLFSLPLFSGSISRHRLVRDADIIYLHFVAHSSFVSLFELGRIIRLGKPVIFITRDMWPITGGCHTFLDCEKYQNTCTNCPCLTNSNKLFDVAKAQQKLKASLFKKYNNIHFIGISRWNAEALTKSAVIQNKQVTTIHNCINTELFKPTDKNKARRDLGLPSDRILLGFGARSIINPLKGFDFVYRALLLLKSSYRIEFDIVTFGRTGNYKFNIQGVEQYDLGSINNRSTLVSFYNSIDIFINPTIFENFGNTAAESIACGTPVVGFKTGGLTDIIDHKISGYLADTGDIEGLVNGINEFIDKCSRFSISESLHLISKARFNREKIFKKHFEIIEEFKKTLTK